MCILDILYSSFNLTDVCFHVTITIKGKTNEPCVDLWEGVSRHGWPSHHQYSQEVTPHSRYGFCIFFFLAALAAFRRRVSLVPLCLIT